jgi:heat shock protein HslJ
MTAMSRLLRAIMPMVLTAICCGTSLRAAGPETNSYPLCGTTWVVTHIIGDPVKGHPTTLTITGNEASGQTSGGNRYTAKIKLANPYRLHFGPIASTRMASLGTSGKQDAAFFKWLDATASYCLDHDYLVFLDGHFSKLIEFAPQSVDPKH